jgi:PmbA protein
VEEILVQAKKVAEEAEVFSVASEETQVYFEANRLKHLQTKQQTSMALRIIRQGRIGYAVTTNTDDYPNLVDNAVETAQFGMTAKFELPSANSYPQVDVFSADAELVPVEAMVTLGKGLIAAVTGHTAGIICEAEVTRGVVSVRLMNSRGGQAEYRKSYFSLGMEGNLTRGTDMLFVGDSASSCRSMLEPGAVADNILQQLELARNQAPVSTRSMPVVFTPNGVASALVMPLLAAFNGKTVLEGASPLGQKLGKKVFDRKFQLWDDPVAAFQPSSRPCDDEGVPSQRTPLIEAGRVTSFLYDLQTAAMAGTRSTGNGRRGHGGLPAPSPSAFVIAPGDATFDDMIDDIKEGLVVEQLMGAGQGNVLGGDFSGNVLLGYKVENGKIVGRVKDTMVSGNVYRVLKDIAAFGSQARWVGGFLQTPHIYCPSISVASKG